ncbi:ketopantoate reductase family protein [Belnapia sp. T18]|uniref:2-dehydropantoate 2-reductase n=1 Tax=Belnapia arida TaxID=2804533 RepID=A0ABS1U7K5_9PROT|nr:ketopantoate reductase family protein [Belnapia arida]MBL6080643.1 ketopantoate reductase family protein [Belnapia arida]
MRVLVVGAGALGGYFGGRLVEAGRDVTFLVRPHRAEQISQHGLRIESQHGDADLRPRTVLTGGLDGSHDLILLAVKAYSLDAAMNDMAPAVGPGTTIVPVLNGMRHIDLLAERFGAGRVLGGTAVIAAALGPDGRVVQGAMPNHDLIFGEVAGGVSDRVRAVAALCKEAKFAARASEAVVGDMWQKWVGLAALAGMNCLMRGAVGDFPAAPGGREAALALLAKCRATASAAGHPPRPEFVEFAACLLTREGSTQTASMLRDIEGGGPTEGEHVLGDLAERAERMGVPTPVLRLARCHVAAYEVRRERERTAP